MINLSNLKPFIKRKRGKRIGRGNSSGHGTYAGRGQKGQRSRSGGRKGLKLKGLKPIIKKVPKLGGFKSLRPKYQIINLTTIEKLASAGIKEITPSVLFKNNLIRNPKEKFKILAKKDKLSQKVNVTAHAFSKSAEEAIKKLGGVIKLIK